jgi:hypothetical protein
LKEEEALEKGMEEMSEEFVKGGAEVYLNPDCSLGLWGNLEASFRHSEAMSNRSGSNGYH